MFFQHDVGMLESEIHMQTNLGLIYVGKSLHEKAFEGRSHLNQTTLTFKETKFLTWGR